MALTVAASTTIISVTKMPFYQLSFGETPSTFFLMNRHWFNATLSLFLLFVYFLDRFFSAKPVAKLTLMSIWILLFPSFAMRSLLLQKSLVEGSLVGYSNWAAFAPILEAQKEKPDHLFAPLNPYPWFYPSKNGGLNYLMIPPAYDLVAEVLEKKRYSQLDPSGFKIDPNIGQNSVFYVGMLLNKKLIDQNVPIVLEARNDQNILIGEAKRLTPDRGFFTFFKFEQPLKGISTISFKEQNEMNDRLELGYDLEDLSKTPLLIWVGTNLQ